jgi:2-oxoglutarate dehydrogenase E2 component (dihydrolipoamide succinyltransferase)
MSELEHDEQRDPVEALEESFAELPDDVVARAYVTRIGGPRRVIVGEPIELRRDQPVLTQVARHIRANASEGGLYEVKLKGQGGRHVASGRFPMELGPAPEPFPRVSPAPEAVSPRLPNPSPPVSREPEADPIALAAEKIQKLDALRQQLMPEVDEVDEEEELEEDEEEDDDEEAEEEDGATDLLKGLAGFVSGETGKAILGRLSNGFAELLENKAALLAAQAAGKVPLAGTAPARAPSPPPAPPAPAPETDSTEEPEPLLRIVLPEAAG